LNNTHTLSPKRRLIVYALGVLVMVICGSSPGATARNFGEYHTPNSTDLAANPTLIAGVPLASQNQPVCYRVLCLRTPLYYYANLRRLKFFSRDILISGVNSNHPVNVYEGQTQVRFALRSSLRAGPQQVFNQQFVATQLSMALVSTGPVSGANSSGLSCYRVSFQPVKMQSTGVTLTTESTFGDLVTQCDVVAIRPPSAERDADMLALAGILSLLNKTCR